MTISITGRGSATGMASARGRATKREQNGAVGFVVESEHSFAHRFE